MKKTLITSLLLCCLFLCSCNKYSNKSIFKSTFSDVTFYAGDQVIGNYQNVSINTGYRDNKLNYYNDDFYYQVIDANDKIIAEYPSSTVFKAIP